MATKLLEPKNIVNQYLLDDLSSIRELYQLKSLSYIDFVAAASLQRIFRQWRLLAEFNEISPDPGQNAAQSSHDSI